MNDLKLPHIMNQLTLHHCYYLHLENITMTVHCDYLFLMIT